MPEPTLTHEPGAELLVDIVIPVLDEAHVLAKSVVMVRGFLDNAVTWHWRRLQAQRLLNSTRHPASHTWSPSS
jgi:hypothetical protein